METRLRQAEADLRAAMLASDTGRLATILDEGLVWVHASGKVDTKASLVEKFQTKTLVCKAMDTDIALLEVHVGLGVITGRMTMHVLAEGIERRSENLFTSIWTIGDGMPRLRHWQSTRSNS